MKDGFTQLTPKYKVSIKIAIIFRMLIKQRKGEERIT